MYKIEIKYIYFREVVHTAHLPAMTPAISASRKVFIYLSRIRRYFQSHKKNYLCRQKYRWFQKGDWSKFQQCCVSASKHRNSDQEKELSKITVLILGPKNNHTPQSGSTLTKNKMRTIPSILEYTPCMPPDIWKYCRWWCHYVDWHNILNLSVSMARVRCNWVVLMK
mgnify:CR=1 FL=1